MATNLHANLKKEGANLHVHNRTESKAKALLKEGAVWESSPADIAQKCDITFSSMFADDGLISTFKAWLSGKPKKGSLYVDTSTVYPGTVKQLTADATDAGLPLDLIDSIQTAWRHSLINESQVIQHMCGAHVM
jgi:3-hydroxyisobutyrate dehydrogenase